MRDSQRQKVYDAEREAFEGGGARVSKVSNTSGGPAWGGFGDYLDPTPSIHERNDRTLQLFVNKVFESRYVIRKWGKNGQRFRYIPEVVTMRSNAVRGWARYIEREIALPNGGWHRRRSYVLHECAHHIAHQRFGDCKHDWRFAMIYLDLVRHFMGKSAHDALKSAYKNNGVRFKEKQTRNYTPEQREAMRERMAHARAQRGKR